MPEVISQEVAVREVTGWLDYKKISEKDREAYKDHVEGLISSVVDGSFTIDPDTNVITHRLKWSIEGVGNKTITDIKYKPRLLARDIMNKLQSMKVSASDADGRIKAIICELSGESSGVIGLMDTIDYRLAQNVAVFFV